MLSTHLGIVALLVVFPVVAAITGAALAVLRPPSAGLKSGAQHFAAGAVLAAVALDMLPGLQKQGHLVFAVGGFVLGAAVLIALRQLEKHGGAEAEAPKSAGLPIGLLAAVAVDLFVDGVLVGLSVASLGRTQGVLLTVALTLVIFPLALSVSAELLTRGVGALKAASVPPLLSLALVAGALVAVVLLGSAPVAVLAAIIGFGVAALLFLAAEELLVEAHESADTPLILAMFFAGFIVLYVLDASH